MELHHFNKIGSAFIIIDSGLNVTFANHAAKGILGYNEKDILGRSFVFDLMPERARAESHDILKRMFRSRESSSESFETPFLTKTGAEKIFLWNLISQSDESGKISSIFCSGQDITQHLSIEDTWKKYEFIINTSKEFMSLISRNYIYEAVNESLISAHNKKREHFIGKSVSDVFGDKMFRSITKIYLDKCFGGHEVHYQERVELPIAGERFFDVSYYPYAGTKSKSITHAVVVARDITERKRNEDEIQHSHALINSIFENIPHAIFLKSARDFKFVQFNKAAEHLLGYPKNALIGKNDYDIFPAERADQLREKDREVIRTKKMLEIPDETIITKDKKKKILNTKKLPILDENGNPQYLLGIAEDITNKIVLEEALRKSEEKYRKLFEDSKDVIVIFKPAGEITDINPSGLDLFRIDSIEQARNINFFNDFNCSDTECVNFKALAGSKGFIKDFEMVLKLKDGHQIYIQLSGTAVTDKKNNVTEYRCIIRDVTERKKIEHQLLQSQRMESLGLLAGGISHEFNNLLTGILGYASFIKNNIASDNKFFEGIQIIEDNARRAASLTTQLLTFARGGKYKLHSVNLNQIVKETLKIISSTFDKNIEVENNLYSGLPAIDADASQIQQALMNICINSKEAMPSGGKLVLITGISMITDDLARQHTDIKPGSYVTLSITDTGQGIDAKTRDKLFEPFFTTKDNDKSVGLGLFMAYSIIKSHNGFINVYSEPGEGSTFEIYIPASMSNEVKEEPQKKPGEIPRGSETILIADDEKYIRSFAKNMLETYGYKVMLAENGLEAAEIYKSNSSKIGLVILDMIMPKMSGYETYVKLKEINPEVKVIFSSGMNQDAKSQDLVKNGGSVFFQKPYQIGEILNKVRDTLDGKAGSGRAAG